MSDNEQTTPDPPLFDFDAFPPDTFFHERRTGVDRRGRKRPEGLAKGEGEAVPPTAERRTRKERRRRVDPTTFEKQYTPEELEFMGAMQEYKVRTGKTFPTYGEVLDVASRLGYRQTGARRPIDAIAHLGQPVDPEDDGAE
jgi:hypothetical protein